MTHLALCLVVVVVVKASLVVDGVNLVSSTVSSTVCNTILVLQNYVCKHFPQS